jgi:hypothetical protein
MFTGAGTTLVHAIAVDGMAEGGRLMTDQDFGRDGVGMGGFYTFRTCAHIDNVMLPAHTGCSILTKPIQRPGENPKEE